MMSAMILLGVGSSGSIVETVVLENTVVPSLAWASGSEVGDTATGTPGTWNGTPDASEYRWLLDATPITGETSTTLYNDGALAGGSLQFSERVQNAAGWSAWADSAPFSVMPASAPGFDHDPVIAVQAPGIGETGDTLEIIDTGSPGGNEAPTTTYHWEKNIATVWTDIPGSEGATYTTPSAGDYRAVGESINGSGSATAYSNVISVVDP